MAWTSPNPQIYNTFASLGTRRGDNYSVSEDCLCILEDILRKLSLEDPSLRTFRRAIGFGQNIRKDLIPLLISVKDDPHANTKIIDTTIKILVNLTTPVECLLCIDSVSRTDIGRHTVFELNRLLATSKEAFTDGRSTKAIVDHMKYVIEKGTELDAQQRERIDNCLLLLRNILHIPESKTIARSNMQNEIVWNLFTQSIDKMIIYLMAHPQKMHWEVTLVQLIALMYKDQQVGTLQKLLNLWLEASLSETSEDNESNTSPQCQGSGESSPILTSDPTSDSSDNGGSECKSTTNSSESRNKANTTEVVRALQNRSKVLVSMKRGKSTETESSSGVSSMNHSTESDKSPPLSQASSIDKEEEPGDKKQNSRSSQSEVSDCGYVTQVENQESISTSSNDDDQDQPIYPKPHTFQKSRYNGQKNRATTALEKKEMRRKKLVKRSKANIILMKGLMHHIPTDEDVSNILKEFTVDFLLKGYGVLVYDLYSQLVINVQLQMDTSHFFWLVTYFLKFATQLELDLEHINPVLSYEVISYLVFQGVWSCEELEISFKLPEADLKPCLRRLHLVVTAIKEFLQALEAYIKMLHVNKGDKQELFKLQKRVSETEDIKSLFLLLLRQYNPSMQSKQYLQDLIVTNHNYLLFLENASRKDKTYATRIVEHLKQFASVEIMKQYGLLLENFKQNGEFVNNCIFTMMHHIAGDLDHVSTLFQPSILKAFSQIWETDYEICDDWSDLIEFVIHKFISTSRASMSSQDNEKISTTASSDQVKFVKRRVKLGENGNKNRVFKVWYEFVCNSFYNSLSWTQEEKEKLLDFYNESRNSPNTITDITKRYENNGSKMKSQNSVIKELLEQNIINERQYNEFMKIKQQPENGKKESMHRNIETRKATLIPESLINGDIKVIREYLYRENKGKLILWLQKVIVETCFVKLGMGNSDVIKRSTHVMEPTLYYYALLNLSVPLVPWTIDQQNILKYQPFILLLHKLGFHLPSDTGKIFVRIPNFWTAEYTFGIAQQLGPIDSTGLKFDVNSIKAKVGLESSTSIDPDRTVTTLLTSSSFENELSITIPEPDTTCCDLPPPELSIVKRSSNSDLSSSSSDMDIPPKHVFFLSTNKEQNKSSTESDLTRMYVSDEEYRDV